MTIATAVLLTVFMAKPENTIQDRRAYGACVAVIGSLAAGAISILLWAVFALYAGAEKEGWVWLWYLLVSAGLVGGLRLKSRPLAANGVALGSVLLAVLVAVYGYGTAPAGVTPPQADPLGLVLLDVRDAPIPASTRAGQSLLSDSHGVELAPEDERPGFPGGKAGLQRFAQKHLHYPLQAHVFGRKGIVHVLFTVQVDGRITNVETIGTVGWGCPAEAQRVVMLLPGFAPARRNGAPIAAQSVLTFSFSAR
ncbi:energy transducer TonB [Hymenobacter terrigena]